MGLEDGDAQGWTTHTRRTNADTRLSLTSKGIDSFDVHGQRHKTDLYEHETGSATKRSSKEKSGEEARRWGQKKKQARQRQGDVHMVWGVFGVLMCWTSPPPKAMDATFLIDGAFLHSILYVTCYPILA